MIGLFGAGKHFSAGHDLGSPEELLFQSRFIDARQAQALGLMNRVVACDRLLAETLAYAADVARNDPFELRTTKLAINQAQDAQGFTAHIHNAFSTFMVRRMGAQDPGHVLPRPADGKRQPMVQVALERYQRERQRGHDAPDKSPDN